MDSRPYSHAEEVERLLAAMRAEAERAPEPPPLHLPRCRGCDGEFPREALNAEARCSFCRYET